MNITLYSDRRLRGTRITWDEPEPIRQVTACKVSLTNAVMNSPHSTGEEKLLQRLAQEAAWDLLEGICSDEDYATAFYFFAVHSLFWDLLASLGIGQEGGAEIAGRAIAGMNGRDVIPFEEMVGDLR